MSKRQATLLLTLTAILALGCPAAAGSSNSLAELAAKLGEGEIRFSFPAREDACGCRDDIWIESGDGHHIYLNHDDDWDCNCERGPVRIRLRVRDGEIVRIRARIGEQGHDQRRDQGREIQDLGLLEAQDAADRLLELARGRSGRIAEEAIFPAYLARDAVIWPELMTLARDDGISHEVREQAIFWLGQIAGDKITAGLVSLAKDDDEELDLRETAIFVLSQRENGASVPALEQIALQSPHPELRRSALFWLAQSEDERALDLIERILTEE
jgi:hypothetical protein